MNQARKQISTFVQVGNSFLSHFPWARVAVNKGRYLSVDLTAKEVKYIERKPACFGFCPLAQNTIAFETRERTQRQPVPEIAALVATVSQARLTDTRTKRASFRTRHSLTGGVFGRCRLDEE